MQIIITGSGTPMHVPGRAGPGVLLRVGDQALQFDVGRGTTLRLADAGQSLTALGALFITHHHSDHLVGLADLLMLRWLEDIDRAGVGPLPVIVPDGPAATIVDHGLDVWADEIDMRKQHSGRPGRPAADTRRFAATNEQTVVWEHTDIQVSAVTVRHEPVAPAVAFRIDGPTGSCVISGDTTVCAEVEALAEGADVLVHEAFLSSAIQDGDLSDPEGLAAYHAEVEPLAAMAQRAGVGHLVLTHLIPPPDGPEEEAAFERAVRLGGFDGTVTVARDLSTVTVRR